MLAAFVFLFLGAFFGAFLRLPAFMLVVLPTIGVYAFFQCHRQISSLSLDILIALAALQAGYALMIIARLLLNARADQRPRGARATEQTTQDN